MKKPELRDILFCCIMIACAAICCITLIIFSNNNQLYEKNRADAYIKKTYTLSDESNVETEDEEQNVITFDDHVYITENGGAFHIDKNCVKKSNNLIQVTLKEAIEMEKTPCSRCLKDYVLIENAK